MSIVLICGGATRPSRFHPAFPPSSNQQKMHKTGNRPKLDACFVIHPPRSGVGGWVVVTLVSVIVSTCGI